MAIIHDTTMTPSKLELLKGWLPAQPWYLGNGRPPELSRAGGFRLDDPAGHVGIEFMAVTDRAVTYLVPMTYRGAALPASAGLIGTARHGVLGDRWIYDGTWDPVLVTQLAALIQGQAEPQAQSVSSTPDFTVTSEPAARQVISVTPSAPTSGPSGTELRLTAIGADGAAGGELVVRVNRILRADAEPGGSTTKPGVSATWREPDGTRVRGAFVAAEYSGCGA